MARRDKRGRVLRNGESIRADGKYQFKYTENGKPKFVYSWRLEETDKLPTGKRPCKALRTMEKEIVKDMDLGLTVSEQNMTVMELVEKYLMTKTQVRPNTKTNYNYVCNILRKESFSSRKIRRIKVSDAKLFLIKLQDQDGRGYSTVQSIRGVLRPAFQMAVDDDILVKNPFSFELASVVVNDSVTREAITKKQMRQFLDYIKDSGYYGKYYEAVYILFHTGLRISEFCGLTISDIDFEANTLTVDHQLLRYSDMSMHIEQTKTSAGRRVLPMSPDVRECFQRIIENRPKYRHEPIVDGYTGFLYLNQEGSPMVAMNWEHRFKHALDSYNKLYREQLPKITPHVCRHTYCSNMARSGMNPKTLQYLMGHSDIGVTMDTYTHLGLDDAELEMKRLEAQKKTVKEIEEERGVLLKFEA